jgi:HTH-type transcriptional regulator/antitoxin HigA
MPEQAVNLIASGKCGISPEMALALGNAFDVSADYFASLQRAYETIIGERLDDADENKCGDCGRPVKPTDERCPHCGAA